MLAHSFVILHRETINKGTTMYIERIKGPADVKRLNIEQMERLADEMRQLLIEKLSNHGGHVGPNLGMVEATIAMHYVFDSPVDKMVFDVSHQSYAHKMLTGRCEAFMKAEAYDEVSGYSEPSESEHDHFVIGHTSTSVSLASGLAKARDLCGERSNVIAIIGDGSLSGGEAFEGLNVGAELGTNFIVIVNDNQMSIAENHGGLYQNLQLLRDTNGEAECNYFRAMGYDYIYVADGNNVKVLIEAMQRVKDCDHPVVLHMNTLKGKGYHYAEQQKERFHWSVPFDIESGQNKVDHSGTPDYGDFTASYLLEKMKQKPELVAMTAGTPAVFGFTPSRREEAGSQFIDMGIAEEQAVAMASGIAKGGGRPVFGVYSTFIQRAYDQVSQDLCVNGNPALLLVFWGGLGSMNDVTHLCFFDIPLLANIPNLVYLAPTCIEEYEAMMAWGIHQTKHPVAIRVPGNGVQHREVAKDVDYDAIMNQYEVTRSGSRVAIVALGSYYQLGEEVANSLKSMYGLNATLINPRFITGVDEALLEELKQEHELVVTLEDGVLDGGFGEKIARYYGTSSMKVLCKGARKEFVDRYDLAELLKDNRLTAPQIVEDCVKALG